jgi:hypothetical protein
MENTDYEKITKTIDEYSKTMVGILCKRIEILDQHKVLNADLYKALVKEHIYEGFRHLKALIGIQLKIGKIIFEQNPEEEK